MITKRFVLAIAGAIISTSALAGTMTGQVAQFDPAMHRVVLTDKSVVTYDPAKIKFEQPLKPGDVVETNFSGAEGDMAVVNSIKLVKK